MQFRVCELVKSKGVVLPLAVLRIMIGFMLLWAFFDKMFGLGLSTPAGSGMIDGGSPTHGFLSSSNTLSFLAAYSNILDVVIMLAFLLIGIALMLGIGMKIATITGALVFLMMYVALFPPENNPILDDHIIYIFVLMAVYMADAGSYLGLGNWWKEQKIVKRFPFLE
jgi:thiosulfate dehydrogenase (quinone) large subunit